MTGTDVRRVASFDVFDTVLTRRVGAPHAFLHVLAGRLATQGLVPTSARVFATARIECDRDLTAARRRHAPLAEIYAAVAAALSAPPGRVADWVEAEQALERELSVALPGAAERVARARKEYDEVVFVSDTPHSAAFVRGLLEQAGLAEPGDEVFTSAGRAESKAHGGLFAAVEAELGGHRVFTHVGDNRRSDLAAARVEGWSSALAPAGRLDRYEELLERRATDTEHVTSWLAGASRIARLEAQERGVDKAVAEVAAGSFGPLLVGYALWVVGQARAKGLERLYFVARDGAVMLRAAEHVIGRLAPDLELRYLYGSRQPWIFGASATSDTILERWVTARRDFTPRTALARVHLTPEQVHELTGHPIADPARADVPLAAAERDELAALLQRSPLVELVREAADRTAEETLAYFRQEGLLDGTPSALVDAGWEGRTAAAFDHLVRRGGGRQLDHLVIGILPSAADPRADDGVRMTPWQFDRQRFPGSWPNFPAPNLLVEMWCAGTEGRTLGYEQRDGRWRPVLGVANNQPVLDWGLEEMQAVAVRVAELVAPYLAAGAVHVDLRRPVEDVLRAFWTAPTPAEAAAWGCFPWEEEIWPPFAPVAQQITLGDVLGRLRRGDKQIRRNNSWRAGSAVVSGQPWRALLQLRAWQDDNRARLQRVPRRLRLEAAARRGGGPRLEG